MSAGEPNRRAGQFVPGKSLSAGVVEESVLRGLREAPAHGNGHKHVPLHAQRERNKMFLAQREGIQFAESNNGEVEDDESGKAHPRSGG